MIKIFKIGHLPYTPFDEKFSKDDLSYLNSKGVHITSTKNNADIFIAGNHRSLRRFIIKNPGQKNYLIWAQEPRFSKVNSNIHYPFLFYPKVHVMNVYTGDVFISEVTYQKNRFTKSSKLKFIPKNFLLPHKKTAALMSFYNGGTNSKLIIEGRNIDLIKKRSDIALYLWSKDMIDIYGQGWPSGISIEDSRFSNRHTRKYEILKNYSFNLCFENTVYPKYITEKIWESIESLCLPIYYGGINSSIYEIFPKESFIDYSEFESPKKLLNYMTDMTSEEFIERINKCIVVYNKFCSKPEIFWDNIQKNMLDNIVKKLEEIK
ncbi:glycosyltransferase family 10 domain-containing protein [Christiangramia salexigens]|uniref:Fucosyltransferase C-terminal domain-containing protein n=1 Tax=Christiangramia salexigens TaxID=1913577 RepID=A0A1L3J4P7_9FLAO|nr:glycosyltransferase family 10 [Christiangramia salexigens]APG60107.1 hypothetical protein LPB144_06615 [Christiangramia salexigens]